MSTTIKIKKPDGGFSVIKAEWFDPAVDEKYEEPEEEPAPKEAPAPEAPKQDLGAVSRRARNTGGA